MTAERKMRAIVEAAGECWHVAKKRPYAKRRYMCSKCGEHGPVLVPSNPSPTDLNELFRLAAKTYGTAINAITFHPAGHVCWFTVDHPNHSVDLTRFTGEGFTPAEALLNALYKAVWPFYLMREHRKSLKFTG